MPFDKYFVVVVVVVVVAMLFFVHGKQPFSCEHVEMVT